MYVFDATHIDGYIVGLALITALLSTLLAMLVAIVSERYDALVSGIFRTIPLGLAPICVAFILMGDKLVAVEALYGIPSGIMLNAVFLLIWRNVPPLLAQRMNITKTVIVTAILSLVVWGSSFVALYFIVDAGTLFFKRIVALASILIMLTFGIAMHYYQKITTTANHFKVRYRTMFILLALLSFASVAGSIFLSVRNEIMGGLMATFPSHFMLSMISFWIYQGTKSEGKVLNTTTITKLYISQMVLGSLSSSVFSIVFAEFYEFRVIDRIGFIPGLVVAVISSLLIVIFFVSLPILYLLKKLQDRARNRLGRIVIDDRFAVTRSYNEETSHLLESYQNDS